MFIRCCLMYIQRICSERRWCGPRESVFAPQLPGLARTAAAVCFSGRQNELPVTESKKWRE